MRRDIVMSCTSTILDDIHNEIDMNIIKKNCEEFRDIFYKSDVQFQKDEIYVDRLKEYIQLIQMTGISEDELFENKKDYYDLLEENLPELWADIDLFAITTGKGLVDYLI